MAFFVFTTGCILPSGRDQIDSQMINVELFQYSALCTPKIFVANQALWNNSAPLLTHAP